MIDLVLVACASALAGFVDAVVGGGGLILLPALFALFPGAPPALLLGTNKAASVWGTAWACVQYARRVQMNWRTLAPAVVCALLGALAGAWAVTRVDARQFEQALPFVLAAVLAYTLARKDLGRQHAPRLDARSEALAGSAIAAVIGFYDGFFGPGTGSFFIFLFVRLLGHDFLHASAHAKLLNTATNASALALFASQGLVWWEVALVAALANVFGAMLGARLAIRRGAGFVRTFFVVVVGALIINTAYNAFFH